MNTKSLMFLAVVAYGASLWAEPLDERHVAADAKWLVHADFDALRSGPSANLLAAQWLHAQPARLHLAGIRAAVGIDLKRDLHGATLYGRKLAPDRGVLIVRASLDRPRVTAFMARQPGYAKSGHGSREVHTWTDRRGAAPAAVFAAFDEPDLLLISRDADDLAGALAVLDGQAASLADGESALRGPVPRGAVLVVRAAELSQAKLALKSPILRLSDHLNLTLGETSDGAFAEMHLTATAEAHVSHFHDIATGLIALARLMRADDNDFLQLLDSVTLSTEGRTVSARWSGQLADVLRVIGREQKRKQTTD